MQLRFIKVNLSFSLCLYWNDKLLRQRRRLQLPLTSNNPFTPQPSTRATLKRISLRIFVAFRLVYSSVEVHERGWGWGYIVSGARHSFMACKFHASNNSTYSLSRCERRRNEAISCWHICQAQPQFHNATTRPATYPSGCLPAITSSAITAATTSATHTHTHTNSYDMLEINVKVQLFANNLAKIAWTAKHGICKSSLYILWMQP